MNLVYGDEVPRGKFSGRPISEWSRGAVMAAWKVHVENRYFLAFMLAKGNVGERMKASQELSVADRKISFWERHPAFDKAEAGQINTQIKRNWAGR